MSSNNFEIRGLNELEKFFNGIAKKAEEASGEVSFEDLFSATFMEKYTKARNIEEFFVMGGFIINSEEDLDAIDETQLNEYVVNNTPFETWEEMLEEAGTIYIAEKLSL